MLADQATCHIITLTKTIVMLITPKMNSVCKETVLFQLLNILCTSDRNYVWTWLLFCTFSFHHHFSVFAFTGDLIQPSRLVKLPLSCCLINFSSELSLCQYKFRDLCFFFLGRNQLLLFKILSQSNWMSCVLLFCDFSYGYCHMCKSLFRDVKIAPLFWAYCIVPN